MECRSAGLQTAVLGTVAKLWWAQRAQIWYHATANRGTCRTCPEANI